MDFNAELLGFQGAMLSADNLRQFSKLTSAGGNEEDIHIVLSVIHKFFTAAEYVDENGLLIHSKIPNIRKIAMYIILNTDLPILEGIVNLEGIESIIWSIPTIPKHLMCEIMWRLGMDAFVYEIIQQSWPQLGLEVAEAFLINFKYLKPTECLNKLYNLTASCYTLICRLTCFQIEPETLSNMLASAFELLQKYLRYYTAPPNRHVLEILRTDETYTFEGLRLKYILFLVDKCLHTFAQSINLNDDNEIYKLTYNEDNIQDVSCEICNSTNKLVMECLLNSNIFLLDIFQQIVMGVSVDMFCAWSEFPDEGMSMQQAIGEICDSVYTKIQNISSLSEHPVCSMIKVMARKPIQISDIINSMDTPAILEKINSNDEQSRAWIHALVKKQDLCSDLQLVQVIKDNIKEFDHQECFALFNTFSNAAANAVDNEEFIYYIKMELFAGCSLTDKHTILKKRFRNNRFTNSKWIAQDFDYILVEVFNKLVNEVEPDYSHVLTLFYQHPHKVYTKIFSLAAMSTLLITPMCQLMELLRDYHDYHYFDNNRLPVVFLIIRFTFGYCTDNTEKEVISNFVIELKNRGILEGSQILMSAMLPSLNKATRNKNLKRINIIVNLLHSGYTADELSEYQGPILMIIAQLMEVTRLRTLKTYRPDAIKTLNKVLLWQKHLMDTYKNTMPELCRLWLKRKLLERKPHPLNLYYFKPLWKPDGLSFLESVTEHSIKEATSLNIITLQLLQILPWTTLEEWVEIWDNLVAADISDKHALGLFHKAMMVLIKTFNKNHTQAIFSCIYTCYHQLMYITRFKFFKEPLTNAQVETCLHFMRRDFQILQPIDVIELEQVTMSIFVYLACMKEHYTVDVPKWFEDTSLHAAALLYVGSPSLF